MLDIQAFPSEARTAAPTPLAISNVGAQRAMLFLNVTDVGAGAPSIKPFVEVVDPVSGNTKKVFLAAAAVVATGQYAYYLALGASGGSFTEVAAIGWPAMNCRVGVEHANADEITYSLGISLV
jgi:hypothetical protein